MIASEIQIFKKTIFFNQVYHEKKTNGKIIIKMASAQENINSISWNSLRGGNISFHLPHFLYLRCAMIIIENILR